MNFPEWLHNAYTRTLAKDPAAPAPADNIFAATTALEDAIARVITVYARDFEPVTAQEILDNFRKHGFYTYTGATMLVTSGFES